MNIDDSRLSKLSLVLNQLGQHLGIARFSAVGESTRKKHKGVRALPAIQIAFREVSRLLLDIFDAIPVSLSSATAEEIEAAAGVACSLKIDQKDSNPLVTAWVMEFSRAASYALACSTLAPKTVADNPQLVAEALQVRRSG